MCDDDDKMTMLFTLSLSIYSRLAESRDRFDKSTLVVSELPVLLHGYRVEPGAG